MQITPVNIAPAVNASGSTSASALVTPVTITSANVYVFIQNISTQDMYVGIGFNPTTTTGILLKANGGSLEYDGTFLPTGAYNIITAGTQAVQPYTCIYA